MGSGGRSATSDIYYFFGRYKLLPSPTAKTRKMISGYHYRCYRAGEPSPLFIAHNFRKGHAASLFLSPGAKAPDMVLKLRTSFPLTGKIDLIDNREKRLKGVVTRGRKVYDPDQNLVARFLDPRTWKEHLGGSVLDSVGDMLFGGGDSPTQADGADRFLLVADKTTIGALSRRRLPFFPDPPKRTEPRPIGKAFKKILPAKIGRALFDITPPLGWKLEVALPAAIDDSMLLLCGALMTIDIRRW